MRLCVDCKYHDAVMSLQFVRVDLLHLCTHDETRDKVTGRYEETKCKDMRRLHAPCGPDGKLFVDKPFPTEGGYQIKKNMVGTYSME